MLHEVTHGGGVGFCHQALPSVLPWGYHGPLVVALDSNILIDLQDHGAKALNGDSPDGVDKGYADELEALGFLLNLWLLRDIRFVVTPTSLVDAKRITARFESTRGPTVEALAVSLAFQFGDWNELDPSRRPIRQIGHESGLPAGPDRALVLEAQAIGAHVFLTRDKQLLSQVELSGPRMAVEPPTWLSDELILGGAGPIVGGTCGAVGCPYARWPFVAGDMGKFAGLMSILGGEE